MRLPQLLNGVGIVNHGGDFESIAHDTGIGEQAGDIALAEPGNSIDFVISECHELRKLNQGLLTTI